MRNAVNADRLAGISARLGDTVIDPTIWPEVLDQISVATGSVGAGLLQSGQADEFISALRHRFSQPNVYFQVGSKIVTAGISRYDPFSTQTFPTPAPSMSIERLVIGTPPE